MASPLEVLLRPVSRLLNRNISESTPARALASELQGSTIAIHAEGTALRCHFTFDAQQLTLATESEAEPDVLISASLISLVRMLASPDAAAIRSGQVRLRGDAIIAQRFEKLLAYARPDVEEELSQILGDVAAHQLAQMARSVRDWAQQARATTGDNVREYLQEESRAVPTRYEAEKFAAQVGVLRDDVARAAARLQRLTGAR